MRRRRTARASPSDSAGDGVTVGDGGAGWLVRLVVSDKRSSGVIILFLRGVDEIDCTLLRCRLRSSAAGEHTATSLLQQPPTPSTNAATKPPPLVQRPYSPVRCSLQPPQPRPDVPHAGHARRLPLLLRVLCLLLPVLCVLRPLDAQLGGYGGWQGFG